MPTKIPAFFILSLLLALHITANYYTVKNSRLLWEDGDAWHIVEAKKYYDILKRRKPGGLMAAFKRSAVSGVHPQLYQFCLGTILTIKPPVQPSDLGLPTQALNSFFLIILFLSVYGIGKRLYGPGPALLATTLLSFCPVIFGQSRLPQLEMPLTAMLCLFFYLILKSCHFRSRAMSLLSGVVLGTAFLIKETALIFVSGPLIFYFLQILRLKEEIKLRILNYALCLGSAFLIASPVYLGHQAFLKATWSHFLNVNHPEVTYYLQAFPHYYIGWIAFLATVPLLLSYILNIGRRHLLLTLWLLYPLLVFTFFGFKAVRYMMPAMPALFLILSRESLSVFSRRLNLAYPVALIALFTFQYAYLNLHKSSNPYYTAYTVNESGLLAVQRDARVPIAESVANFFISRHPPNTELRVAFSSWTCFENYLAIKLRLEHKQFAPLRFKLSLPMHNWIMSCSTADYLLETVAPKDENKMQLTGKNNKRSAVCLPFFELVQKFSYRSRENPFEILIYQRKTD